MPIGEETVQNYDDAYRNDLISPSASEKLLAEASGTVVSDCSMKNLLTEAASNSVPATDGVTGTPRLSSPLKRLVNAQAALMFGSNAVSMRGPSPNTSNVLKPFTKLSENVQLPRLLLNSKIPKLQKSDEKIASKKSKSIKFAEESDSGVSRRKTFVMEGNPLASYELPIISNEKPDSEDLSNENASKIEPKSRKTNKSRKTFVVKTADNPEDCEIPPCDRRKTFVKNTRETIKISLMGENKIDLEDLCSATAVTQLNQNDLPNNECSIAVVQPDNSNQALCDDISAMGKETSYASSTKENKIFESISDEKVPWGSKMPSSFEKDSFEKIQQKKVNFVTGTKLSEIENIDENDRGESEEINCGTKESKNGESDMLDIISDKQVSETVNKSSKTENVGKKDKVEIKEITCGAKISKNKGTIENDSLNIKSDKKVFSTLSETENVDKNDKVESKEISGETKDLRNDETTEIYVLNIRPNDLLNYNGIEELIKSNDDICAGDDDKSLSDVLESSDSSIEMPDFDIISPKLPFKTIPIRRRISKSKPKKVFKFDGYKKKSTSRKASIGGQSKSKTMTQCANICQPDVNQRNNIELENQNDMHSNIAGKSIDVAASCEASKDKSRDAAKKHELAKPHDKNAECKNRNQNEGVDLKDCIASTSSKSNFTNKIDIRSASVKHNCSHLVIMDEQITIDYQNKKSEVQNCIARKSLSTSHKSVKRIANGDSMKSLPKKCKTNSGKNEIIDICEEAGDTLSENKLDNLEQENHLGAKVKKKLSCKTKRKVRGRKKAPINSPEGNTFSTQAEIHSPPPCFRTLENYTLDKENDDILPLKSLHVVLSDVMKMNPKKETDVSDRSKTMIKSPLSSSSFNIHPPVIFDKDEVHDQSESEGK